MGKKIKAERENKGMSQVELAEKADTTVDIIVDMEDGSTQTISSKLLLRIASALGISIDRMFFSDEPRKITVYTPSPDVDGEHNFDVTDELINIQQEAEYACFMLDILFKDFFDMAFDGTPKDFEKVGIRFERARTTTEIAFNYAKGVLEDLRKIDAGGELRMKEAKKDA